MDYAGGKVELSTKNVKTVIDKAEGENNVIDNNEKDRTISRNLCFRWVSGINRWK